MLLYIYIHIDIQMSLFMVYFDLQNTDTFNLDELSSENNSLKSR